LIIGDCIVTGKG